MNIITLTRTACAVLLLSLMLYGIYGSVLAINTFWPGIHEDGSLYTTVVVNQVNNIGNRFDVYPNAPNPNNEGRNYNYHGQLYPAMLRIVMKGRDYESLLTSLHAFNLAALIGSFVLLYICSRRSFLCSRLTGLMFAVGGSFSVTGVLHYLQGRPDHGALIALLFFSLLRYTVFTSGFPFWIWGPIIGTVGGFTPIPGAFLGLFHFINLSLVTTNPKRLILKALQSIATALLTWSLLTSLTYRGSLVELAKNTALAGSSGHSGSFFSPGGFPVFSPEWVIRYWVVLAFAPGLILSFLLAAVVLIGIGLKLYRNNPSWISRILAIVCSYFLFSQVWYMALNVSAMHYTLVALFPFILILTIGSLGSICNITLINLEVQWTPEKPQVPLLKISQPTLRRLTISALLLSCSVPGLGFLKSSLVQSSITLNGTTYHQARQRYLQIKQELAADEVVLINAWTGPAGRSAVIFDKPPWKMRTFNHDHSVDWLPRLKVTESQMGFKGRFFFFAQDGSRTAPVIDGFRLVENKLNNQPVLIFGRIIRSTTPDFGYAIYVREE